MTKSRNSIEVVKVEIVVVVEVGVKVASGKVVENLEVVEEAEWRETRMVNSRVHNWLACWDQRGTGGEIDNEGRTGACVVKACDNNGGPREK